VFAIAALGGAGTVYHRMDGTTAGRETALCRLPRAGTSVALVDYNLLSHVTSGAHLRDIIISR
jgi:hypothetical protein